MVKKRHWTFQISLTNIVLLILAFIINLLGDWISEVFKLPFWLDTTLSANAWNYVDEAGHYYLCCSTGVKMVSITDYDKFGCD